MRISSLIAAALIVAGLGYWFVLRHGGEEAQAAVEPAQESGLQTQRSAAPVPVQVFTSQAIEHQGELLLKGRTEANRNVNVAAETTGRVISDPFRRGAEVAAGQVLCELDPGVRAAELAEAEAALAEAQVDASASKQLNSKGFTAETTLRSAEARLQAAAARLDKVRLDIQQLAIRAPFDGILESDTAELGAFLSPGTVCANVIDLAKIKVTTFVAEQDIELLSIGQNARIRLVTGATAEGEITFLSRAADEDTRTYAVEVTLDNPDRSLRDGMTAELAVALPARKVHRIPQSALTLNDAGTLGVRVDDGGTARFMAIKLVGETPDYIRISGLPDTADIIVVGQEFVRDGRAVKATQFQLPTGLAQ